MIQLDCGKNGMFGPQHYLLWLPVIGYVHPTSLKYERNANKCRPLFLFSRSRLTL